MITPPRKQPYKNILLIVSTIIVIIGLVLLAWRLLFNTPEPELTKPKVVITEQQTPTTTPKPVAPATLPLQKLLTVPFTAQAPTGNWDELHNEACEEASAIMAHAYFSGATTLTATEVEIEIAALTKWQQEQFGYYLSITTEETAQMLEQMYSLTTTIVPFSESAIKKALSENKLVIYPADGRLLKNPNFKQPGPPYHMLVITGYDEQEFITNDPGTRKGYNYRYSYETLYTANGTWNHAAYEVDLTDKQIIIVSA